jgi:hypothetical protein
MSSSSSSTVDLLQKKVEQPPKSMDLVELGKITRQSALPLISGKKRFILFFVLLPPPLPRRDSPPPPTMGHWSSSPRRRSSTPVEAWTPSSSPVGRATAGARTPSAARNLLPGSTACARSAGPHLLPQGCGGGEPRLLPRGRGGETCAMSANLALCRPPTPHLLLPTCTNREPAAMLARRPVPRPTSMAAAEAQGPRSVTSSVGPCALSRLSHRSTATSPAS